jgi:hypothetical protein
MRPPAHRGRHSADPQWNAGPGNFHDATLEVPIVTRRVDQISRGRQLDRLEVVVFCAIAITCPISNTSLDCAKPANLRASRPFSMHKRDRISSHFLNRASSARASKVRTASVSRICRGLRTQSAAMCRGRHAAYFDANGALMEILREQFRWRVVTKERESRTVITVPAAKERSVRLRTHAVGGRAHGVRDAPVFPGRSARRNYRSRIRPPRSPGRLEQFGCDHLILGIACVGAVVSIGASAHSYLALAFFTASEVIGT